MREPRAPAIPVILVATILGAGPGQAAPPATDLPVGKLPGTHGPPFVVEAGGGAVLVTAYVLKPDSGADIYAWRVGSHVPDSSWPEDGLAVCSAEGDQLAPIAVPDGRGGFIVAWQEYRKDGGGAVLAQHILEAGRLDPVWPPGGVEVGVAAGPQTSVRMTPDGSGGALIVWEDSRSGDSDVYLQHVLPSGQVDPAFSASGRPIVHANATRVSPTIVADGIGGAIVTWEQFDPATDFDIYAHHILASGESDPAWPEAGKVICAEAGEQADAASATDGAGGAFVAWMDRRDGELPRIYVDRIPASAGSQSPPSRAGQLLCDAPGSQRYPSLTHDGAHGVFVAWQDGRSKVGEQVFLQHLSSLPAIDPSWPQQGLAVSSSEGLHVSARPARLGEDLIVVWLDRTVPGDVRPFAQRVLHDGRLAPEWPAEGAVLSRSAADDLLATSIGPAEATAVWREAGSWALRSGQLTSEVPQLATLPDRPITALFAPRPNPALEAVTLRFSLAGREAARLTVFDVTGRRVVTPLDQVLEPGPHEIVWQRLDAAGRRVGAGVYFVRFEAGSAVFNRRIVVLR